MTDKAVEFNITQKVYGEVIEYRREIAITELETAISQVVQEIGTTVLVAGLNGLDQELRHCIEQASGKRKEKLKQFYQYIYYQQDGFLDLSQRDYPSELGSLGALEGNVDKPVGTSGPDGWSSTAGKYLRWIDWIEVNACMHIYLFLTDQIRINPG